MEKNEMVDLMLKSSDHNPYTGLLSKKENIAAAIELSELCKDFARHGFMDEAMGLDEEGWDIVLSKLKAMGDGEE